MTEIWIPNQREHSEKVQQRMGVVPFEECSGGEPHYFEAKKLRNQLRSHDDKLSVDAWYGRDEFRWIINWTNREGVTILVRTIEDENEAYAPPHEGYLHDLRKHDMWGRKSRAEQVKLATEADRRQEAWEKKKKEEEMAEAGEKIDKMYRDAGWSQRGDNEDIENFSFAYGATRGKLPT